MARKKRERSGDAPKRRRRPAPRPADKPDLPDRRAMEGMMQQVARSQTGAPAEDTPLARAQALMYRAFEERDGARRVQLANEALTISPNCADAYVVLAEHAPSRKKALKLYEKGVAAGERALGPDAFRRDLGHFWGLLETRPYMRARLGLAHALWVAGRRDEAVQHLQDMMRLNPGDNQGVRYTLAGFLLFLDRDDDLARLLQQYADEGSATWAYTRALLAFRRQGDALEARQLLKAAKKANKHVPEYLLGRRHPPLDQPGYYSPGDNTEALEYVGGFMAGWKSTPGAVAWVRANDAKTRKGKATAPEAKGPLRLVKDWLNRSLPQQDDVWQAGVRQFPNWVRSGTELVRPWLVMVGSRSNDVLLAHQMPEQPPSAAQFWDTLVQAMQHPMGGTPHRPTELQVRPDERWDSLKPHLEEIGVALVVKDELDQIDAVFDDMFAGVGGDPQPGLLDVPGVTPEQVGSFFGAAASFFRQAPWKKVGYESAIRVACDKYQSGPWFAVLMGQSGLTMGLALYDDLRTLQRMWSQDDRSDEANAVETVGTSVTFGEAWEIAVTDLDAATRYGWPVARPDAYPSVFRKERGMSVRLPLAWELELLEGCLRTVPDFVGRRAQDDPAPEALTVPVASGPLTLTLSWVTEDDA
jgi:tetratricopeptide (TPR) repeat protein